MAGALVDVAGRSVFYALLRDWWYALVAVLLPSLTSAAFLVLGST